MQFVLGVDGGGTKTQARLFRVGPGGALEAVSQHVSPGSNPYSVGWPAAEEAIRAAVAGACGELDALPSAVVLAVAGCASEPARERLAEWASGADLAEHAWVVPDTEPLLANSARGRPVIGLIAGTGSSAIARSASGVTTTVGGWGYLIDDTGSGYAIGRDALHRLAGLADAGGAADALSAAVLRHAGVDQPAELKALVYGAPDARAWIARLAPVVIGLAESGDAIAARIVEANVAGLAELALNAAGRVAATGSERPPVLLAGGLMRGSDYFRRLVGEALVEAGWTPEALAGAPDAATGCARLAFEKLSTR